MQLGKRRARCRDCEGVAKKLDRDRFQYRHRADIHLNNIMSHGRLPEPLVYSRAVCEHVRLYVERAMDRWERATEMEAPPHLTALKQITDGFVKEHPPRFACRDCGGALPLEHSGRTYCRSCALRRKKESQARSNRKHRKKVLVQEGRSLVLQARRDMAKLFRVLGLEYQEIADRMGMANNSVAWHAVHHETSVPYMREYQRKRSARLKSQKAVL